MRPTAVALLFVVCTVMSACATSADDASDPATSDDEIADLDQWANTSGGKADLPTSWTELVAWVTDFYRNKMSAIWHRQEHPATPAAAMTRIRALVVAGGVADPTRARYRTTVQRLRTEWIDHSEVDVALPGGKFIRLVGDPKGAGAFVDGAAFQTALSPALCLTWSELNDAVAAAYQPGAYGVDYVCHTVTEKVLRALHVGSSRFADQVRTYQVARWIWGPVFGSGNSQDPADWPESRACN